jgi:hypothetical protein
MFIIPVMSLKPCLSLMIHLHNFAFDNFFYKNLKNFFLRPKYFTQFFTSFSHVLVDFFNILDLNASLTPRLYNLRVLITSRKV